MLLTQRHDACGLVGTKPVNGIEVALWVANQRVRPLIPVLHSGSCRKQSAAVMVNAQADAQQGKRGPGSGLPLT